MLRTLRVIIKSMATETLHKTREFMNQKEQSVVELRQQLDKLTLEYNNLIRRNTELDGSRATAEAKCEQALQQVQVEKGTVQRFGEQNKLQLERYRILEMETMSERERFAKAHADSLARIAKLESALSKAADSNNLTMQQQKSLADERDGIADSYNRRENEVTLLKQQIEYARIECKAKQSELESREAFIKQQDGTIRDMESKIRALPSQGLGGDQCGKCLEQWADNLHLQKRLHAANETNTEHARELDVAKDAAKSIITRIGEESKTLQAELNETKRKLQESEIVVEELKKECDGSFRTPTGEVANGNGLTEQRMRDHNAKAGAQKPTTEEFMADLAKHAADAMKAAPVDPESSGGVKRTGETEGQSTKKRNYDEFRDGRLPEECETSDSDDDLARKLQRMRGHDDKIIMPKTYPTCITWERFHLELVRSLCTASGHHDDAEREFLNRVFNMEITFEQLRRMKTRFVHLDRILHRDLSTFIAKHDTELMNQIYQKELEYNNMKPSRRMCGIQTYRMLSESFATNPNMGQFNTFRDLERCEYLGDDKMEDFMRYVIQIRDHRDPNITEEGVRNAIFEKMKNKSQVLVEELKDFRNAMEAIFTGSGTAKDHEICTLRWLIDIMKRAIERRRQDMNDVQRDREWKQLAKQGQGQLALGATADPNQPAGATRPARALKRAASRAKKLTTAQNAAPGAEYQPPPKPYSQNREPSAKGKGRGKGKKREVTPTTPRGVNKIHTGDTPRTNSGTRKREDQPCYAFQTNTCPHGSNCRYGHFTVSDEVFSTLLNSRKPRGRDATPGAQGGDRNRTPNGSFIRKPSRNSTGSDKSHRFGGGGRRNDPDLIKNFGMKDPWTGDQSAKRVHPPQKVRYCTQHYSQPGSCTGKYCDAKNQTNYPHYNKEQLGKARGEVVKAKNMLARIRGKSRGQ